MYEPIWSLHRISLLNTGLRHREQISMRTIRNCGGSHVTGRRCVYTIPHIYSTRHIHSRSIYTARPPARTHARTRTPACIHACMHTRLHAYACMHARTHARTDTKDLPNMPCGYQCYSYRPARRRSSLNMTVLVRIRFTRATLARNPKPEATLETASSLYRAREHDRPCLACRKGLARERV
jgi:hypothetical protein